jgi:hypothetical protein
MGHTHFACGVLFCIRIMVMLSWFVLLYWSSDTWIHTVTTWSYVRGKLWHTSEYQVSSLIGFIIFPIKQELYVTDLLRNAFGYFSLYLMKLHQPQEHWVRKYSERYRVEDLKISFISRSSIGGRRIRYHQCNKHSSVEYRLLNTQLNLYCNSIELQHELGQNYALLCKHVWKLKYGINC